MTNSARSYKFVKRNQWASRYTFVSYLLVAAMVTAYVGSLYLFAAWRHDLMIADACEIGIFGNYSRSQYCLDVQGWMGWGAAVAEAIPFTAVAMLALLGVIYGLLGKQLDLRPSNTARQEVLIATAAWTSIAGIGALTVMGAVTLFV